MLNKQLKRCSEQIDATTHEVSTLLTQLEKDVFNLITPIGASLMNNAISQSVKMDAHIV